MVRHSASLIRGLSNYSGTACNFNGTGIHGPLFRQFSPSPTVERIANSLKEWMWMRTIAALHGVQRSSTALLWEQAKRLQWTPGEERQDMWRIKEGHRCCCCCCPLTQAKALVFPPCSVTVRLACLHEPRNIQLRPPGKMSSWANTKPIQCIHSKVAG